MFAWTPAEPSSGVGGRAQRRSGARSTVTSGVARRGLRPRGMPMLRCRARIARVPPPGRTAKDAVPETLLPYRAPLDWKRLLDWLSTRAVPGLESVEDETYRRGSGGRGGGGGAAPPGG